MSELQGVAPFVPTQRLLCSTTAAAHQVISDFALDLLKLETGNRLFLPIMKRQIKIACNMTPWNGRRTLSWGQLKDVIHLTTCQKSVTSSRGNKRYVDFAAILDAPALPQSVDRTLQSSFYKGLQVMLRRDMALSAHQLITLV